MKQKQTERVERCLEIVLNTVSNDDPFMLINIIMGKGPKNLIFQRIS